MFTGYIQLVPLKSRRDEDLIEAVLQAIIRPFGIPKYFRCDSETSMFNSAKFYKFMQPLNIEFLPCSTGAPWSNGAAERAVNKIKIAIRKFVQQEHVQSTWDEYLHFFPAAHNKSVTIYGTPPEQLHFGFTNPAPNDIFQIWPDCSSTQDYVDKIIPLAEQARLKARKIQVSENKRTSTYKNALSHRKIFKKGDVVLQRKLTFATGPGKAMKPTFKGPYVITEIDKDLSSALIEDLNTGEILRAHFTNLTPLSYHPKYQKFPDIFDEELLKFLPEKYSKDRYYPSQTKKVSNEVNLFPSKIDNPSPTLAQNSPPSESIIMIPIRKETDLQVDKENILMPQILLQEKQIKKPTSKTFRLTKKRTYDQVASNILPTIDENIISENFNSSTLRRSKRAKKPPDKFY